MQAIPIVLAVGGSMLKAYGQDRAGRENRRIANAQALEEENAGAARELRIREEARKAIGEQLAAQSSNGFLGGTGSALDALRESQVNAVLDAMTVRRDAAGKARSLRAQGQQAFNEGRMGAIASLVSGAGQAFGMSSDWAAAKAPYGGGGSSGGSADPIIVTHGK